MDKEKKDKIEKMLSDYGVYDPSNYILGEIEDIIDGKDQHTANVHLIPDCESCLNYETSTKHKGCFYETNIINGKCEYFC